MLNTSHHIDIENRLQIVEDFIQSMVNSGHRYAFVKSVVLQALTRYDFMCERGRKNLEDPKYLPLYRKRDYRFDERVKLKHVDKYNWFTNLNLKDPFRNMWKFRVGCPKIS